MRLLVTRPEPQGERTAAALRARGHEVMLAPLMHIEPVTDVNLGRVVWTAVLITSANAVRFLNSHPSRTQILALPLLAVGERSAQAAREAGFANVMSADGDVNDLVQRAARAVAKPGPLLYLAGEDRAGDLAGALGAVGYRVNTAVVYRARIDVRLPEVVARALGAGEIDGVLHYSKRSAETFLAAAAGNQIAINSLKCNHFCLSDQVAEPLRAKGARVVVAGRPEEAAVLDLVGRV
jgi:uroporphyrinogen-III synthase